MSTGLFDIHCHILPGVDDGSKSLEMTMEMIERSYAYGVRNMIATPHFLPGNRNMDPTELEKVYENVKSEIAKVHPDYNFYLGNEVYYKDEMLGRLKNGEIHTLAGSRYVLIEFNEAGEFSKIDKAVQDLVGAGYVPVIAHAERYQCLVKHDEYIARLIKKGAYIQLNAENFSGGLFNSARSRCLKLIQNGLVHFIASDCHNLESRKPDLNLAIDCIEKKLGEGVVERLMARNPGKIVENKFV